jgi:hypothetical protein
MSIRRIEEEQVVNKQQMFLISLEWQWTNYEVPVIF